MTDFERPILTAPEGRRKVAFVLRTLFEQVMEAMLALRDG